MSSACAASAARVVLDDRRTLDEVRHAERRGEPRAAARRQHVAGAGDVVAHRLGRVRAEKQRAGGGDQRAPARARRARPARRARAPGGSWRRPSRRRCRRRRWRPGPRSDLSAIARRGSRPPGASTSAATRRANVGAAREQDRHRQPRRARPAPADRRRSRRGSTLSSAPMTTSVGPAIESMPTSPNTRRLAAAT